MDSFDHTLQYVADRGHTLTLNERGDDFLLGNVGAGVQPPLKDALRYWKPAIVQWLKGQTPQRIVLLPVLKRQPGQKRLPLYPQDEHEAVLVPLLGAATMHGEIRRQAQLCPGRLLAGEWQDKDGRWKRFIWKGFPPEDGAEETATESGEPDLFAARC